MACALLPYVKSALLPLPIIFEMMDKLYRFCEGLRDMRIELYWIIDQLNAMDTSPGAPLV